VTDAVGPALARVSRFVSSRGDPLARARAAVACDGAPWRVLSDVLPEPSDFAGALRALTVLAEAGALDGADAVRAVRWLEGAQQEDGAWEAGSHEAGRLVATGLAAGLLARSASARAATLRRAGGYLAARWGPERVQGGDFGLLAGFCCFFANTPHELSDAGLQWCGREWERGFRAGSLDPVQAARVLVLADAPALPAARVGAQELVAALLAAQQPDGGWLAPEVAPERRVEAAVEAAVALRRLAPRR
jgi:hypothetical protein